MSAANVWNDDNSLGRALTLHDICIHVNIKGSHASPFSEMFNIS